MSEVIAFKTAADQDLEEYRRACKAIASLRKILFDEYIKANFTPDQAIQLMCVPEYETIID